MDPRSWMDIVHGIEREAIQPTRPEIRRLQTPADVRRSGDRIPGRTPAGAYFTAKIAADEVSPTMLWPEVNTDFTLLTGT